MKKNWFLGSVLAVLATSLMFVACKKDDDDNNTPSDNFDRKAMLTNYADNYIVPAYADMVVKLNDLQAKSTQFTSAPTEQSLGDVRTAFRSAYTTWQKVDMLEFGPGEDVSLRMYVNTYPVTVSKVNANISSGNYDLEQFAHKDAQGFAAVDYLLNGIATGNTAIVEQYTTDAQAANRKKYLQDVIAKMVSKVQTVSTNWGTYKTTFINSTGVDASSSTSKMVNAFVLYFERYLRAGKIGLPVGAMTGVAKPELTEAFYSPDLQKELAVASLTSVLNFYEGKSYNNGAAGIGMKTYLAAIGTKDDNGKLMADLISEELQQALTTMQGVNGSIAENVTNNRTAMLQLYDELQQVVPLLKVDMVSAFGISITYVDNDGD
ncbi:imelysin family protein [Polluticoccus soli]|uniref:imelysin family protein n=1 Tax=Polluticoccus soli TaxID=3034150 RepID=UPI0023E0A3DA|nr:imelysin family protein [Flavipsychrobacter sp. JY13-12]